MGFMQQSLKCVCLCEVNGELQGQPSRQQQSSARDCGNEGCDFYCLSTPRYLLPVRNVLLIGHLLALFRLCPLVLSVVHCDAHGQVEAQDDRSPPPQAWDGVDDLTPNLLRSVEAVRGCSSGGTASISITS